MTISRAAVRFPVLLLLLIAFAPAARAAWPTDPSLNLPICTATGTQGNTAVVSDGAGGVIIAWEDERSGGSDIYAQRVSVSGTPLWAADGVLVCTATGNQHFPTLVSDGAGGAIVTWTDYRDGIVSDIFAQRVNASGSRQWTADGVAICTAASDQLSPMIASDGAGGAIVTWADFRSSSTGDIYAQRASAAGVPQWTADGVALCTAANDQNNPTMVSDGAGGAIATWQDFRSGTSYDIYAQRVNAVGVPQWIADGVALCTVPNAQQHPTIASDGAGGAIAVWNDFRGGSTSDVYAQQINAAGAPLWTANGVALCTQPGDQAFGMITTDGAGGAIVAWHDYRSGGADIYAQRVNVSGVPQWIADGTPICTAPGDQTFPIIASDGFGGAYIVWTDWRNGSINVDIYSQHLDAAGITHLGPNGAPVSIAPGNQYATSVFPIAPIALDGTGTAIVAWTDTRNGDFDVYAQRIAPDAPVAVLVSLVSADATPSTARLVWFVTGASRAGLTVERRAPTSTWHARSIVSPDGSGFVEYDDVDVIPGARLGYRLNGGADSSLAAPSEVWLDIPVAARFALRGGWPNPAFGPVTVSFSLADAAPATIELLDVAGRQLLERDLADPSPGDHLLTLKESSSLRPGLYLLRLRQGSHQAVARLAVMR